MSIFFCYRDALSHHAARYLNENRQLEMMQNVTDLLRKTFSSQFVFPAMGHDDPTARKELGKMWSQWLPTDALRTFEQGEKCLFIFIFLFSFTAADIICKRVSPSLYFYLKNNFSSFTKIW